MKKVGVLILAAGNSSRMGSIKQLLPWENTTLMAHSIHQAERSNAREVLVVLGANFDLIRRKLSSQRGEFVENKNWKRGLGTSISCGVGYALSKWGNLNGLLVMLADQPLIDTSYLNLMIEKFETSEKGIIATKYKSRVGVPAIFSFTYFQELKELHDDFGAKKMIAKFKDDIFEMEGRGKTEDIDTLEDYKRLKNFNQ